jgi:uncharacterized protein YjiS (DUF1127 family)
LAAAEAARPAWEAGGLSYAFFAMRRRNNNCFRQNARTTISYSMVQCNNCCDQGVNIMFLAHLVSAYQHWRRYNRSLRELNQLSDRELADIGISRGDIPRVAWEKSER